MQIENSALSAALALLKAGRAARNIAGGTTNYLLEANGSSVTLVSSNLVSETACTIPATRVEPTSISVPPEFGEIVERCPSGAIDLKATEKRAAVNIGASKFKLPILPGDSFPKLAVGEFKHRFKVETSAIKKVLAETIVFAPTNDPRLFLNGVQLTFTKESVIGAATNGHVLSVSVAAATIATSESISRVMPIQAARQLSKIIECDKTVDIGVADKVVEFKCGGAVIRIKPVEGNFPNWRSLLKEKPTHTVEVKQRAVLDALSRVALFTERSTPAAAFEITSKGIDISASTKDGASSSEHLPFDDCIARTAKQFHARTDYVDLAVATITTESLRISYFEKDLTSLWFRKDQSDDCVIIVTPYKA